MKKKNNAAGKKKNLRVALAAIVVAFVAIIATSIYLRPDTAAKTNDDNITEVSESLAKNLTGDDGLFFSTRKRSKEENRKRRKILQNLSQQMNNMSEKTKKNLTRKIIRQQITKLKEKTAKMSENQKHEYIANIRETIRHDFKTMSKRDSSKIRSKMSSSKGKKEVKDAMDTFYNEMSANDRKLYDPLVMDMISGMNQVMEAR
jgi:hypothetical protein